MCIPLTGIWVIFDGTPSIFSECFSYYQPQCHTRWPVFDTPLSNMVFGSYVCHTFFYINYEISTFGFFSILSSINRSGTFNMWSTYIDVLSIFCAEMELFSYLLLRTVQAVQFVIHKLNAIGVENQIQGIVLIKIKLFPSSKNGVNYMTKWL